MIPVARAVVMWLAVALGSSVAQEQPVPVPESPSGEPEAEGPSTAEGQTAGLRRVLILQSFGGDFDPLTRLESRFRTRLSAAWGREIDIFSVPFDLARFDEGEEGHFVRYLGHLVDEVEPDLVVALVAPAIRLALEYRQALFPDTPLLLGATDHRFLEGRPLDPLVATVPLEIDLPAMMRSMFEVLPDLENLAIVIGTTPLERFWRAEISRELAPFEHRARLLWLDDLPLPEILLRVSDLPPRSAVLFTLLYVDAAGVPHEGRQALIELAEVANAPVFGIYDTQLGTGIVGGPVIPVVAIADRVAEVSRAILSGAPPASLRPAPMGMTAPTFDQRALRRWGIPERRLPAGSSVRFRQPPIWQAMMWPIIGLVLVVALETVLIASLMLERRRRRAATSEVQALTRRLLTASEDERRWLARELHDDISQRLARLSIDVARIERSLPPSTSTELPRAVRGDLVRLSDDVHALSRRLHPSVLTDLGLSAAVRSEAEHFADAESLRLALDVSELDAEPPRDTALCLLRVVQEALRNVARHARASQVEVVLRPNDGGLELRVNDDGVGFAVNRARLTESLGHLSLRERLSLVGGVLDLESTPGQGTTLRAWVPVDRRVA